MIQFHVVALILHPLLVFWTAPDEREDKKTVLHSLVREVSFRSRPDTYSSSGRLGPIAVKKFGEGMEHVVDTQSHFINREFFARWIVRGRSIVKAFLTRVNIEVRHGLVLGDKLLVGNSLEADSDIRLTA